MRLGERKGEAFTEDPLTVAPIFAPSYAPKREPVEVPLTTVVPAEPKKMEAIYGDRI